MDDGEHAARPRHAARLGNDGRRLRRERQAQSRQDPDRRGGRRRLGLQLRRSAARRQRPQRLSPHDRRQQELGHELGRGRGRRRVSQRLLLLPAAAVQPLHRAGVRRILSERRAVQARRGRAGAARRGQVQGRAGCAGAPARTRRSTSTRCATSASTASVASRASSKAWRRRACGSARGVPLSSAFSTIAAQRCTSSWRNGRWRCRCIPSTGRTRTSTMSRRCRPRRCGRTAVSTRAATAFRRHTWSHSSGRRCTARSTCCARSSTRSAAAKARR